MRNRRSVLLVATVTVAVALAGIVVAQPAAAAVGFTINCNQAVGYEITSPGTYVLRGAVANCGSDTAAIRVSAPNVTLDLNGYLVDGDDAGGAGVRITGSGTAFKLRNGTVTDFGHGVEAEASGTVSEFIGRSNTNDGINASASIKVLDSVWSYNGDSGIQVEYGNEITGNTVANNDYGIYGYDDNEIVNNHVTGNGESITFDSLNRVSRNRVIGNDYGIYLSDDNAVSRNVANGNLYDGIYVGNRNVVVDNVTKGNGESGIDGSRNNRILTNIVRSNASHGIYMSGEVKIKRNIASGNGANGIYVITGGPDTSIAGNTANGNVALGIDSDPGTVGDGTNKAKENGNPAQCAPVSLCA